MILNLVLGGVAGINLLVGGMNTMLLSVTERTREIGIRKIKTDSSRAKQEKHEHIYLDCPSAACRDFCDAKCRPDLAIRTNEDHLRRTAILEDIHGRDWHLQILGTVGLILPWALNLQSRLTPFAAAGLTIIMIGAVVTHLTRGGMVLAAFVAYARTVLVPRTTVPPGPVRQIHN